VSKHALLTDDEFAVFVPSKRRIHHIEQYRIQNGLSRSKMNVLDWGCGRGLETLWLREHGYSAYGVDLDAKPIANGIGLFERRGHPASALRLLQADGLSSFPDGFFHFTFSNQVFEHIADLEAVATELWRVTASSGEGHHIFPAHKSPVEGHLFMPLVHWLPKNELRKCAIRIFVTFGREPHWAGLEQLTVEEKTQKYYQYSVTKTYYRSPSEIRQTFEPLGFRVSFETINHPRVNRHPILGNLKKSRWGRAFVNFLLLTFVSNELHVTKRVE